MDVDMSRVKSIRRYTR